MFAGVPFKFNSVGELTVAGALNINTQEELQIQTSIVSNIPADIETQLGILVPAQTIKLVDLLISTQFNCTVYIYLNSNLIAKMIQTIPNLVNITTLNVQIPSGQNISVKVLHGYPQNMWGSLIFKYK